VSRLLAFAAFVLVLLSAAATPDDRGLDRGVGRPADTHLPFAAAASISRTIGRNDRSYLVRPASRALQLVNREHRLDARFTGAGLTLRRGRARVGVVLSGYGRGRSLHRVGSALPAGSQDRVEYRRGPLTEWYVNGPIGLEQGFTLAARPPGAREPLTISLALAGPRATLDRDRRGLTFRGADLRYRSLAATDVTGRSLRSWLELAGARLRIRVDDRGARYPVAVDPFFQQDAKLTSSDGAWLGPFLAVSGDTVVVGAGSVDTPDAAYVFVRPPNGWTGNLTETARLAASDSQAADAFGNSVAIVGDTIVVGAPQDDVGANLDQGSAYVFVRPPGGWAGNLTETAKLTASGGEEGDALGATVAMVGDTVVAGAPCRDQGAGAAYVFTKPAGGWGGSVLDSARLTASDSQSASCNLGLSVAASGDTIVAGAPHELPGFVGSAYVFVEPVGGWAGSLTENAKLRSSDRSAADSFAAGVAIAGDTIVAGAPGDDGFTGSAYVFVKPAGGWGDATENAKLTTSDQAANDHLGFSVAVSDDTIVAGAPAYFAAKPGFADVFVEPAVGWHSETELQQITATDGAPDDAFGQSVALSGDTAAVEAPGTEPPGAAYVFGPDTTPPTLSCGATPTTLWSPDHKLASIITSVQVTDAGSGASGFTLLSVTSNQPDSGPGFGPFPNDIQDWTIGADDTSGTLRAERYGSSRTYTLSYEGTDLAGNTSTCTITVGVPVQGS
jgi:FG-GAP repeat